MATPLMLGLRSKLSYRVTCTVSINNKNVCVHDSIWKRCKVSPEPLRIGVNAGSSRNRKDIPSPISLARSRLHGGN